MVRALPSSVTRKIRILPDLRINRAVTGWDWLKTSSPRRNILAGAIISIACISSAVRSAKRSTSSRQLNGSSGPDVRGYCSR